MADDEQESPLIDFNKLMPDPNAIQGQVQDQWTARIAQAGNNPVARNQVMTQMYGQQLAGGDPRVAEALQQRQAMQGILQQVNSAAPDNEDPLAYQERLSHAMMTGMAQVNPQIAMAAAQNLVRVQEARQQRQILQADTSVAQDRAQVLQTQANVSKATGGSIVFARQSEPDAQGLPQAPQAVATLDANSPDFAQQAAQLQSDAKAGGYTLVPLTPDQFMNGRNQIALTRGQFAMQAAQMRANSAFQAALLRSQQTGQGMDGRTAQMSYRVLSGAEMSAAAVENVANMEFGASSGFLGTGLWAHGGESLFDGTRDTLRNELTPQEQQMYTTFAQPLWRGISAIEAQGGLQGGQRLAEGVKAGLEIHPGDKPLTIIGKLAQARQDITTGVQVQLSNPKLDPAIKAQVQTYLAGLVKAIPFTVADVQAFTRAQEKNPKLTFAQFAAQNNIGQAGAAGGVTRLYKGGRAFDIPNDKVAAAKAAGYSEQQ